MLRPIQERSRYSIKEKQIIQYIVVHLFFVLKSERGSVCKSESERHRGRYREKERKVLKKRSEKRDAYVKKRY